MIGGKKVLALIPARGGSRGIPRKNIKILGGRPLIGWTIEAARQAAFLDMIVVSSEDEEILTVAKSLGAQALKRPVELATDEASGMDPVRHAIDCFPEIEILLLLQPTSPLRTSGDIDGFMQAFIASGCQSAVGLSPAPSPPEWMYRLDRDGKMKAILGGKVPARRQDLEPAYVINGALYAASSAHLRAGKGFSESGAFGYVMPADRSIDIDTPLDWAVAEFQLSQRPNPA